VLFAEEWQRGACKNQSMRPLRLPFVLCGLLIACTACAEDLGTIGPTYPIVERDLIEVIKNKFRRVEKTGELAQLQESYKQHVINGIERPKPVAGIRPSEMARTFYIDPTWTLDRNVADEKGSVLFPQAPESIHSTMTG
jgi:conjugal transfer pilus assembly protein TraW